MIGLRTTLIFLAVGATCDLRASVVGSATPENLRHREALARGTYGGILSSYYSVEREYFFEVLTVEDKVVVFDQGPFKLEASCKTLTHTYSYYDDDSSSYSYFYGPYQDDTMEEYSYTEYVAALDLTFTAVRADYVYGEPSYNLEYYDDDETVIVGSYKAGESRSALVFKGIDGGSGNNIVLQTTTGYYLGIPSDETTGIHGFSGGLPGVDGTFPDGVDCMVSGFINYVSPRSRKP